MSIYNVHNNRRSSITNNLRNSFYSRNYKKYGIRTRTNSKYIESETKQNNFFNSSAINSVNNIYTSIYENNGVVSNSDEAMNKFSKKINELSSTISNLTSSGIKSVFCKTKEVKNEESGEVSYDYDRDKILKAVKEYISDYNSFIDIKEDTTASNYINKYSSYLVQACASRISLLKEIGITFNSNDKMTLDEKKFAEIDLDSVKSLFTGRNSYGEKISKRVETLSKSISGELKASSYTTNNTYSGFGKYSFY